MSGFLANHRAEGLLVAIGLGCLFAAGRSRFMAAGEDPNSDDRLVRALAGYGRWVKPELIAGVCLVGLGAAITVVRLVLNG